MGSYLFKWEHPANEVFVTGTFDDWDKTERLHKRDAGHFDKTVYFSWNGEKVYYKFYVDGQWMTNHTLPQETDSNGNVNNVLVPSEITPTAGFANLSSAAPLATTAGLAGAVPKEKSLGHDAPGAFPETPGFETPAAEHPGFSVNPLPATAGIGNPTKAAEEPSFGVAPIPATTGMGNPISAAPGEKIPSASAIGNVNDNVKLDKESYEKGDTMAEDAFKNPSGGVGGGMFSVPPVGAGVIPESSLPMGGSGPVDTGADVFTQSAAPTSTTAGLAGAVPLEPRGVPAIVSESQHEAHVDPEAAANPEAIVEKREVENELKEKVPEAPAAADSSSVIPSANQASTAVVGGLAAAGAAITGAAVAAKHYLPESIQKSIDSMNGAAGSQPSEPASSVPEPVRESIADAHTSPEAAANPEAVREKSAMEQELERKVHLVNSTGEPAPAAGASGGSTAAVASDVPEAVKESITDAHSSPEAAANPEAVREKSAMEHELEKKVHPVESSGEPAPTITAATTATAPTATKTEGSSLTDTAALKPSEGGPGVAAPSAPGVRATTAGVALLGGAGAVAGTSAAAAADKRDVSPGSVPVATPPQPAPSAAAHTTPAVSGPSVTTGIETTPTAEKSTGDASPSTPKKVADPAHPASDQGALKGTTGSPAGGSSDVGTPDSSKSAKKKKRISVFFDKLKDKLK